MGNTGKDTLEGSGGLARPGRRWLFPLVVFLVCLVCYTAAHLVFVFRTDVFTTDGDEVQYLVLTESIITDHDLSPLNNYAREVYRKHGYYKGDIPYPALVPGTDGRLVYSHMPTMSLLLVPGFWMFGYNGAAGTMILLTCLAAVLVFALLRRLVREKTALLVTLAFFLTYPILIYSRLIYTETVMLFLFPFAIWACLRLKETGLARFALLAGIAAALMFQFHIKFSILSLATLLLLYCCSRNRWRDSLVWVAPVALSFGVLIAATLYLYGPNLIHGLTISSGPGGFIGQDSFWGIFGLYLDRAWGLFIFAPLYVMFIPGVAVPRGLKDVTRWWFFIPVTIVSYTIVIGAFGKWSGEVSPIPRHLVPLMPVLVLCAGLTYKKMRPWYGRALAGLLLAFQAVISVFALRYPLDSFAIHGPANAMIPAILGENRLARTIVRMFPLFHPIQLKSGIILLLLWLIVLTLATVYVRRKWMDPLYLGLDYDV